MKIAQRLLLAALFSAALAAPVAAQIPLDPRRDQGVGFTAGLASGTGISYQEILPSAFGFRAALALWKKGDYSFIDAGLSGLRILSDDGSRRVYVVASAAYWRRSDQKTEDEFDDVGNVIRTRTFDDVDDSAALGLGAGIEVPFGTSASVSFEGVFTYWADSGDLLPLPQVAFHYLF